MQESLHVFSDQAHSGLLASPAGYTWLEENLMFLSQVLHTNVSILSERIEEIVLSTNIFWHWIREGGLHHSVSLFLESGGDLNLQSIFPILLSVLLGAWVFFFNFSTLYKVLGYWMTVIGALSAFISSPSLRLIMLELALILGGGQLLQLIAQKETAPPTPSFLKAVRWAEGILLWVWACHILNPVPMVWFIGALPMGLLSASYLVNCLVTLNTELQEEHKNFLKLPQGFQWVKIPHFQIMKAHDPLLWTLGISLALSWILDGHNTLFFDRIISSIVILLGTHLLLSLWELLLQSWTKTEGVLDPAEKAPHDPTLSSFDQFLALISLIVHLSLYLFTLMVLDNIWEVGAFAFFKKIFGIDILMIGLDLTMIVLSSIILWHGGLFIADKVLHSITKEEPIGEMQRARIKTIAPIFKVIFKVLIIALMSLLFLLELGVNITPLLAGFGILAFALSLGAQDFMKDLVRGANILAENSLNQGDRVAIKGLRGYVEALSLQNVELRDDTTGALHIIPYGEIEEISNYSREYNFCYFEIPLDGNEDPSQALSVIQQTIQNLKDKMPNKIYGTGELWGIKTQDGLNISLFGRFPTEPLGEYYVAPLFQAALREAFAQANLTFGSAGQYIYYTPGDQNQENPAPIKK